jgi:hypothetical protein
LSPNKNKPAKFARKNLKKDEKQQSGTGKIVPKNRPTTRKEKRASSLSCTIYWQRGGGVKLGSAAAVPSLTARQRRSAWQHGCTARRHRGIPAPAATNAVLPPRAVAVTMKTPAVTAIVGAQTINNQLKGRKRQR